MDFIKTNYIRPRECPLSPILSVRRSSCVKGDFFSFVRQFELKLCSLLSAMSARLLRGRPMREWNMFNLWTNKEKQQMLDSNSPKQMKVPKKTYPPSADVRFDGIDHWPIQVERGLKRRCKLQGASDTQMFCPKCKVNLCISTKKSCFAENLP